VSTWFARRIAGAARWLTSLNPLDCAVAAFVLLVCQMLFWPWLQHARDQARVVQTKDNMRRLGTAIFSYSDTHQSFPLGGGPPPAFHQNEPEEPEDDDPAAPLSPSRSEQ